MDNIKFDQPPYHNIYLKDRKTLEITGIKTVDSFDSQEFLIVTALGYLSITGKDLTLVKLDDENGEVTIKGTIDSISYINSKKGKDGSSKENVLGKLFK